MAVVKKQSRTTILPLPIYIDGRGRMRGEGRLLSRLGPLANHNAPPPSGAVLIASTRRFVDINSESDSRRWS